MEKILKNKRFFYILLLICLAGFLILPNISLAVDFDDIDLREMGKYLQLPANKVENLIHSLIDLFNSEWINRVSSAFATAEESAVANIMRNVARAQALNHLLIDAPIEITWKIINNAVKITRLIVVQDISVILNELEKQSVKKATEYGIKFLLQKEIRITPGAIGFEYKTQKGEIKKVIFQYVMIYQPTEANKGKLVIRFYSPSHLEIPKNQGNITGTTGFYTELTNNLPPFIVNIQGLVEDYKWVGTPLIKIDFPPEVPDLGIRPLSWWEKHILKPIGSVIKDVEIIITKVTGRSFGIVNIWEEIKKFISRIKFLAPAAVVQAPVIETGSQKPLTVKEVDGIISEIEKGLKKIGEEKEEIKVKPQPPKISEEKPKPMTLDEVQEMLDDIAEEIDILNQRILKLIEAKKQQTEKEIEEIEKDEKEEEIEELKEKEDTEKKETGVCIVNINTASKEELQKITGVGPVIAQRIIEARPFSSLNDLIRVSGIGPLTLQKIITQSCAYVTGYAGGGASPASDSSPSYPKILISEVQIKGNNINNDFIELYNPNDSSANISGYKLRKRTSGGTESSIRVLPSGSIISKKGYYLWASSKDENYPSSINADTSTTQTLASNNSIALLTPDDTIISALAWGSSTNPFVETSPFPNNPGKNKSLGRIWDKEAGEYKNTGDNSADFEIQTPTPKTQNQSPVPEPEPEPEQEIPPLIVVINEVAWMGTAASSTDEWIELHNTTKNPIDLTGWKLVSLTDNSPNITLRGIIPPLGFYLLKRTNDDLPVSDILADWKGSFGRGGLKNTGEELELRDNLGNLIDKVGCQKNEQNNCVSWFAGNNDTKQTMERIDSKVSGTAPTNWANNNLITRNGKDVEGKNINGTPGAENSVSKSQTLISNVLSTSMVNLPFDEFSEITLTYLGSPYIIGDNPHRNTLTVPQGKILNIEPGVILKFPASNSLPSLEVNGTLKAIGEENNEIVFTVYENEESSGTHWCGIEFTSSSLDSEINYALIERAGDCGTGADFSTNYVIKVDQTKIILRNSVVENNLESRREKRGVWLKDSDSKIDGVSFLNFGQGTGSMALHIQGGSPIIRDSIFRQNDFGIRILDDERLEITSFPVIEENYFEGNKIPIYSLNSHPSLGENEFFDNDINGILIKGNIFQDTTWRPGTVYVIDYYLEILEGDVLTLEPGTIVKFRNPHPQLSHHEAYMQIQGELIAEGAVGSEIVFTSFYDDSFGGDTNNDSNSSTPSSPAPWDWKEITFFPGSSGSLKNVILRYGGGGYIPGLSLRWNTPLVIEGDAQDNVSQENVTIEFSSQPQ